MGACLLLTLPLEVVLGARVYRAPRRVCRAVAGPFVGFAVWDAVAIHRGHWSFNPAYVTGWEIPGGVPVEELAFFVAIPLCALLTYEAVGRILARWPRRLRSTDEPAPHAHA
jgi:lycopene cyclase domain-containing protein